MRAIKRSVTTPFDFESLSHIELFRDLTELEWRELSEILHSKVFSADATLMTVEQPGEAVYFILSSTVKVHVDGSVRFLRDGTVAGVLLRGRTEEWQPDRRLHHPRRDGRLPHLYDGRPRCSRNLGSARKHHRDPQLKFVEEEVWAWPG